MLTLFTGPTIRTRVWLPFKPVRSSFKSCHGCGSLPVCSLSGTVDEAWLQRGLPCS
jgi:hypothetical protein